MEKGIKLITNSRRLLYLKDTYFEYFYWKIRKINGRKVLCRSNDQFKIIESKRSTFRRKTIVSIVGIYKECSWKKI